jgi:hypothetical protein
LEEFNISSAVYDGTGLVNFDNDLSVGGNTPRYQFIRDIFGFVYSQSTSEFSIYFNAGSVEINSWEDTHQSPVLQTTTSSSALNQTDGAWTEFLHTASRPYPAVFAAVNEENFGLPVMRFYSGNIPNGEYEVIAKLYTQISGRNMRYYYGYTADTPKAFSVDTVGGTGGAEQFTEYSLGTTNITSGTFNIYVRDADLLPGSGSYPFFGWAKIRLVPVF